MLNNKWRVYYRLLMNMIVTLMRLYWNISVFVCCCPFLTSCFPFFRVNLYGFNMGPSIHYYETLKFWILSIVSCTSLFKVWSINGRFGSHCKVQIITNIINIRECRTLNFAASLLLFFFVCLFFASFHTLIWSSTDPDYMSPVDLFLQEPPINL